MGDYSKKYQSALELIAAEVKLSSSFDEDCKERTLTNLSGNEKEYNLSDSFYERCRNLKSQQQRNLEPTEYIAGSVLIGFLAGIFSGAGVAQIFQNNGYGLVAGTTVALSSLIVGVGLHRTEQKEMRDAMANTAVAYDNSVKKLQATYLEHLLGSSKP